MRCSRIPLQLFVVVSVVRSAFGSVHYVNSGSGAPVPPYTSWSTAATNIQDAVDWAVTGDQVLVTNGTYQGTSRVSPDGITNRVVITNAVSLQSVNGSAVTFIDGGNSVRGVYLTNGAALTGFTVLNGKATTTYGGGVYCEAVENSRQIGAVSEGIRAIANHGR